MPFISQHHSQNIILKTTLLLALVIIAYLPAMTAGYVWDDISMTQTPQIKQFQGIQEIWQGRLKYEKHYWPITYTTFWLEYQFFGLNPALSHFINLLLHLFNTLLIWHLSRHLKIPGAWFLAAVFGLHPVHVESVAWIIERKDVLSTLFYLLALLCFIKETNTPRPAHRMLAILCFILGMLSKTMVISFPFALLIYTYYRGIPFHQINKKLLFTFFAVAAAMGGIDVCFTYGHPPRLFDYSFFDRLAIAATSIFFYLKQLIWPVWLPIVYPQWQLNTPHYHFALPIGGLLALLILLWALRHHLGKGPLCGLLFFIITLGPILGFIDFSYMRYSFVADRFQYLAAYGPLAILTAGGYLLMKRAAVKPTLVRAAGGLILVLLAVLTFRQAACYQDERTFFGHIVHHNPSVKEEIYCNLGTAFYDQGEYHKALQQYRIAKNKTPDYAPAYTGMGNVFFQRQQHQKARNMYIKSLNIAPNNPDVHANLGATFLRLGSIQQAINQYRIALSLNPVHKTALLNLADLSFRFGHHQLAIRLYRKILRLDPDHAMAQKRLDRLQSAIPENR